MYTTQKEVRAAFWDSCEGIAGVSRRKIKDYSSKGKMYNTDTRCAFCDFVDSLARSGEISDKLADRVTL